MATRAATLLVEVAGETASLQSAMQQGRVQINQMAEAGERASGDLRQSFQRLERHQQFFARGASQAGGAVRSMAGHAGRANQVMIDFGAGLGDAAFGIRGVANNIPQLLTGFSRLQDETGSTLGAIKSLGSTVTGFGGLILATQLIPLLSAASRRFDIFGSSASEAADKVDEAAESVIQLGDALQPETFTIESEQQLERQIEAAQSQVESLERAQRLGQRQIFDPLGIAGGGEALQRQLDANQSILDRLLEQRAQLRAQRRIRGQLPPGAPGTPEGLFAGTGGPQEFGGFGAQIDLGAAVPGVEDVETLKSFNRTLKPTAENIRTVSDESAQMAENFGFAWEQLSTGEKLATTAFTQLGDAIGRAAVELESFTSLGKSLLNIGKGLLGNVIGAVATGGLGAAFGIGSGGFTSLFTQALGFRAHGGPVTGGRPYIVGEGGEPEMFIPGRSGRVVPMSQMGGVQRIHLTGKLRAEGSDLVYTIDQERQVQGT